MICLISASCQSFCKTILKFMVKHERGAFSGFFGCCFVFVLFVVLFFFLLMLPSSSCSQQWWSIWLSLCTTGRAKEFFPSSHPSWDAAGRADPEQLPLSASPCCHTALALQPGAKLFKTKRFAREIPGNFFFFSFSVSSPLLPPESGAGWDSAHCAQPC